MLYIIIYLTFLCHIMYHIEISLQAIRKHNTHHNNLLCYEVSKTSFAHLSDSYIEHCVIQWNYELEKDIKDCSCGRLAVVQHFDTLFIIGTTEPLEVHRSFQSYLLICINIENTVEYGD